MLTINDDTINVFMSNYKIIRITYLTFLRRYGEVESFDIGLKRGDADDICKLVVEPLKLKASLRNDDCEPVQSTLTSVLEGYSLSIWYIDT